MASKGSFHICRKCFLPADKEDGLCKAHAMSEALNATNNFHRAVGKSSSSNNDPGFRDLWIGSTKHPQPFLDSSNRHARIDIEKKGGAFTIDEFLPPSPRMDSTITEGRHPSTEVFGYPKEKYSEGVAQPKAREMSIGSFSMDSEHAAINYAYSNDDRDELAGPATLTRQSPKAWQLEKQPPQSSQPLRLQSMEIIESGIINGFKISNKGSRSASDLTDKSTLSQYDDNGPTTALPRRLAGIPSLSVVSGFNKIDHQPYKSAKVKFSVTQKHRFGRKTQATISIDKNLNVLSILKSRSTRERQAGTESAKVFSSNAIIEKILVGDLGLTVVIADGTHKNKGTKKEFEFRSSVERSHFLDTLQKIRTKLATFHKSNESSSNLDADNGVAGIINYRHSLDIGMKNPESVAPFFPLKESGSGAYPHTPAKQEMQLYYGEHQLLAVNHVILMGQQPSMSAMSSIFSRQKSLSVGVLGRLLLTNFRVLFDSYNSNHTNCSIPLGIISWASQDKNTGSASVRSVNLTLKQSAWKPLFIFETGRLSHDFLMFLRHHAHLGTVAILSDFFAFSHRKSVKEDLGSDFDSGWNVYDAVKDYSRIGLIGSGSPFRLYHNNYSLCETYPKVFVVPKSVDDSVVERAAKYRSRKRVCATVWMHPETYVSLSRCAQPMRGLSNNSSDDDQRLIFSLQQLVCDPKHRSNTIWFVDARKRLAAIGNKAKGKGTEKLEDYPGCALIHLNIENIHHMRRSLRALNDICEPLNESAWDKEWFNKVDESLWLRHCWLVLAGSHEMVRLIQIESSSVVCHCSDGWDRTAQLCATAELLMDPWYRTCKGFIVLIEKEWLSFGHKFHDRCGHNDGNPSCEERSPIFMQWLDVVWQITNQFPSAFEFNEEFLLSIADHHLSCFYGTFLLNSEQERIQQDISGLTRSLWTDLLAHDGIRNASYNPNLNDHVLYPACSMRHLRVWRKLWLRREKPVA